MKHGTLAATCLAGLLLATSVFAQKRPSAPLGEVVDAAGKVLGPVIGTESTFSGVRALVKVNGLVTAVTLGPLGGSLVDYSKLAPRTFPNSRVLFSGQDCTGAAYLNNAAGLVPGLAPSVTLGNNLGPGLLYIGQGQPHVGPLSVQSYSDDIGVCFQDVRNASGVFIVLQFIDLSTVYVGPYSIR